MTNNLAEQSLKTVIGHRKNNSPLRNLRAMKRYGDFISVMYTWQLNKIPIASSLRNHIKNQLGQSILAD